MRVGTGRAEAKSDRWRRYESENVSLNELVLDLGNEVLSKGEHT